MGFMAGFGPSFSRSYEGAKDRAAQERQDVFRLTYQDFMQRQQQYDEWNREDAKAVKTAQDYEQTYDLPEGSWTKIYSWVKSDHSPEQIQEWIQKGQFVADETLKPQAAEAAQGVDAEMQSSGMTPMSPAPPQAAPAAPEQRDTGLFGSLLGNLAQKGKTKTGQTMDQKRRSMALEKIAGNSGRSLEEVQGVMDGYKAPEIPESNISFSYTPDRSKDPFTEGNAAYIEQGQAADAFKNDPSPQNQKRLHDADIRVKALQDKAVMDAETDALAKGLSQNGSLTTLWRDGEYIGSGRLIKGPEGDGVMIPGKGIQPLDAGVTPIPVTKEEMAFRTDVRNDLNEATKALTVARDNAKAMFHHANVMNETVRNTNGEVLKEGTATVTSKIEKWAIDFATGAGKIADALNTEGNEGKQVASKEVFEQAMAAEKALMAADKTDLGAQKLLYDTQKLLLAYRLGMATGQEGRGLAEAERKLFLEAATAGVTVDQFYDNMSNLMLPIVKSIDSASAGAYKKAADTYKGTYNYVPGEFEYIPLQTELATGDTKPIYDEFVKRDRSGAATIMTPDSTGIGVSDNDPVPENIPVVNTPEEAMKLPSGTKFKSPDGKIRTVP